METVKKKRRSTFGKGVNMLEGKIAPSMLAFVVPVVLMSILAAFYSTADMTVLGHFGSSNSVAAVGASGAVTNFLVTLSIAFSVGTNVLLSRAFGSGDEDRIRKTVSTSAIFSVGMGILVTVLCEAFAYPFLDATSCPSEIRDSAATYMRFYASIMPAMFFSNFMANVLRLNGDTMRPFLYGVCGGVTNVLLNLLFVIGFAWDLVGVAVATVIGSYLQAIILCVKLTKLEGSSRLDLCALRFDFAIFKKILRLGSPNSLSCVASSITSIYIQIIVNQNGAAAVAGSTAAGNLENYMFAVFGGFGVAITAFMGQNIGAGNRKRVKRAFFVGWLYSAIFAGILMLLAYTVGESALSSLYLPNDPEAVAFGVHRVRAILGLSVLCASTYSISHALQSFGFTLYQSIVDMVFVCGARILWLTFLYRAYPLPNILYLSFPVSWVIVILASGTYLLVAFTKYMKGKNYEV